VVDEFRKLLTEYPECLRDKKKFMSYMKDLLPEEKMMTNVLASLLEIGIVEEIRDADVIDITFPYRYVQKLMDLYGISEENAATGVYLWCEYYGHQVLGNDFLGKRAGI